MSPRAVTLTWTAVAAVTVGSFVAVAALLAMTIPYHEWDALSYGEWSRLIAEQGGLRFDGISAQTYHRPLFYVLQGWLWGVLGFSFWSGRLLSLLFGVLLIVAVAALARDQGVRLGGYGAALGALLVVAVPDVARFFAAGMTDVPVAAMVGLTALAAWSTRPGRWLPVAVGILSCLAVLTKPTALLALAGLATAVAIGPRAGLRRRLARGVAPLAAGAATALVYDAAQARALGLGLVDFLRSGVDDYYERLASEARWDAVVGFGQFGPALRLALIFALVAATVRVAGLSQRQAAVGALLVAIALTVIGPMLADGAASSLRSATSVVSVLSTALVAAAAVVAPAALAPSRTCLARLLLLAFPVCLVWALYGAYDPRLLAPAWPALLALVAVSLAPGLRWAGTEAPLAALAPLAVMLLVVWANGSELDGLGRDGWREYRSLGIAGIWDGDRTANIVLPAFSATRAQVEQHMAAGDRILSSEGRFRFFYPGRATQSYPATCADLVGYRTFVLLTDEESRRYMETVVGGSADPSYWAACERPRLEQLPATGNGYVAFVVSAETRMSPPQP